MGREYNDADCTGLPLGTMLSLDLHYLTETRGTKSSNNSMGSSCSLLLLHLHPPQKQSASESELAHFGQIGDWVPQMIKAQVKLLHIEDMVILDVKDFPKEVN